MLIVNDIVMCGRDNFDILIIENSPAGQLDDLERYWISALQTKYPNGYNVTMGGVKSFEVVAGQTGMLKRHNPMAGKTHTEEARKKMSAATKASYASGNRKKRSRGLDSSELKEYIVYSPSLESRKKTSMALMKGKKILRSDGKIYDGVMDAAIDSGVIGKNISLVCSGKRKSTGGFSFQYI